jgi:hypothetical protein
VFARLQRIVIVLFVFAGAALCGPRNHADDFPLGLLPRQFEGDERPAADVYSPSLSRDGRPWSWQLLPDGLLYRSYLAGTREPRFGTAWLYEKDRGWVWDSSVGGRAGILRYGTPGAVCPDGWQLDIAGAAFVRLDSEENQDLESADFRFDVPLTWRRGPIAVKLSYYHISSHVGDEFLVRTGSLQRNDYLRDSALLGLSVDLTSDIRAYTEAGWAFNTKGGAEPWEFQFGVDYSPAIPTGLFGAPFLAANAQLREEVDFGGSLNVTAGWQWRGWESDHRLRIGAQYFNGKSSYYSFFNEHEELIGLGLWYDY